jgi:hypothetical protein
LSPRARSTSYDTIRIEMGVKEREMMETYVFLNAIPKVGMAAAGLVGAIGLGLAGYGVYWGSKKVYGWADDAAQEIQDALDNAKSIVVEGVVGKSQYTDPQTEQIYNNPFAGVPVLGGLFGYGMKVGAKTDTEADKQRIADIKNPEGKTELGEGEPLRDYMGDAEIAGTFWLHKKQCWVSPVSGDCVSYDPNDPLYA